MSEDEAASSEKKMEEEEAPINLKKLFEADQTSPIGSVTTEAAEVPPDPTLFKRLTFSETNTVYLLPDTKQKIHKKSARSVHDPWRRYVVFTVIFFTFFCFRYGALTHIHKNGGWSYSMKGKAKQFYKVEKGTPLPPPPQSPPILTEEEFYKRQKQQQQSPKQDATSEDEKSDNEEDTDSLCDNEEPSC